MAGRAYKKCKWETHSGPMSLEFVRVDLPPGPTGKHRYMTVLSEESFRRVVIEEELGRSAACERYPELGERIWDNSRRHYQERFADELRKVKHKSYSNAMKGNTRGATEQPSVLLEEGPLRAMVGEGRKLVAIAKRFGVSEYLVRANLAHYGIRKRHELPYRMQYVDAEMLERLEGFAPGITESAKCFYDDPHGFFLKLYESLTGLSELVWFVKDQAKAHGYYVEKGTVERDHICWSLNRYEMRLSKALLAEGVPHIREFVLDGKQRADFCFPEAMLLVEVDGEYHSTPQGARRDAEKERTAEALGYKVLRFGTSEVWKEVGRVVEEILEALSASAG